MSLFRSKVIREDEHELNYYDFKKLEGSSYVIVSVCSSETGFKSIQTYSRHNYLFLEITSLSTHWLFPNNNQTVISFTQIPENYSQPADTKGFYNEFSSSTKETSIKWLLFQIKSNKNAEKGSLLISDVSGENLISLIDGIDFLRDKIRLNDNSMLILYSSNGRELVSELDLSEKKIVQTKELPNIQ